VLLLAIRNDSENFVQIPCKKPGVTVQSSNPS